jgi:hypothetical protein
MDQLNRRAMIRGILCGAAVVGVGLALPLGAAEAMPVDASLVNAPEGAVTRTKFWPREDWKSQLRFRPRWRLATSGTFRLLGHEACGGM